MRRIERDGVYVREDVGKDRTSVTRFEDERNDPEALRGTESPSGKGS